MAKSKKVVITLLAIVMTVALAFGAVACGSKKEGKVPSITISKTEITLDLYEEQTLTATTENIKKPVIVWTSSDPATATVNDKGVVKAKSEGVTTITATVGEVSATCSVVVENSHSIPILTLSANDIEDVKPNEELTVSAYTTYNGNYVDGISYIWTVDKENVVELTPSEDTMSVKVKGLAFGTVNISCITTCEGVPLSPAFTVNVFNPDVLFEVEDLEVGTSGYAVNLTLFDDEDYDNSLTPNMTIVDGTSSVDTSEVIWSSENEDIAVVENGVIKAKALGMTKVLAFYNNNGIYFDVNVERAEFDIDQFAYLEVAKDNGLERDDSILGTVSSVLYDGFELFDKEVDGLIHLNDKTVEKIGLGNVLDPIKVYTDKALYSYNDVEFVAMIIDSKEEFDQMDEVALSLGNGDTTTPTMDGIFYLNADIEYNDVYTPNAMNVAKEFDGGFVGTFDGRGHTITGLKIEDGGYIFSGIMGTAVVKNVTFFCGEYDGTDLTTGTGAYLSKVLDGKIENVFLHLSKVTVKEKNVMLLSQGNHGTAKELKNVIVVVEEVERIAGGTSKPVLQTIGTRAWGAPLTNVVGIAPNSADVYVEKMWCTDQQGANAKTHVNDYAALTGMSEKIANGWDTDFWHEFNGVMIPKTVSIIETQTIEMGNNTQGIANWKAYKKDVEGVDKSTYKSGYAYNPNLIIDLTSNGYDRVISASINGKSYASYFANGKFTIPKAELTTRGEVTMLIAAEKEGKTVSVIKPLLLADILISDADDFEAMQWLADTYADDVKTENGITVMKAGGYIALTNNITYNRTYKVHERSHSWGDGTNKGFTGTLDGRGYYVDGLEMVEQTYAKNTYTYAGFANGAFSTGATWTAGSGIFASLYAGGTIKNIAFTNAKHNCGGGFITTLAWGGGNAIENVYVHLTYARGVDSQPTDRYPSAGVFQARYHGGSFTIRNNVVVIDKVESGKYYYDFGAFTTHPNTYVAPTRSNVYIISSNEELVSAITDGAPTFATTLTGVTKYADKATATADKDTWSAGLTSSIWDVTGDLPVFASTKA